MTKLFEEGHNNFISGRFIKVLTMNSRADLKDVSEDFEIEVEFILFVHSEPIGSIILVDRIPELVAFCKFWNIYSGEKYGIARSESKSMQDNLKCRFSLFLSRVESSAFSNLKPFLLWDKFKIKFGLLSSNERHDSAKIFHIQFIYKQINISLKDNLDHEE
ncbi:hypothetical protein Tco_0115706 [Tanacetum coccineum]